MNYFERIQRNIEIVVKNTKLVPCLVGEKGEGKTDCVFDLAKKHYDNNIVTLYLGNMDEGDLMGLPVTITDADGLVRTTFARPTWMPKEGKGVIFLDEINRTKKNIFQAIMQLLLYKRVGEHVLPEGWVIVSAMNPPTEDYSVTEITDDAMLDRLVFIKFAPSTEDWLGHARDSGVSSEMQMFIAKNPEFLKRKSKGFSLEFVHPSSRSTTELDKIWRVVRNYDDAYEVMREIGYSITGVAATNAFLSFVEENMVNITPEEIYDYNRATKKKVEKLLSNNSLDMANKVIDDLVAFIRTNSPTTKQWKNITSFLADMPKELATKFLLSKDISDNCDYSELLTNDKECALFLTDIFGPSDELDALIKKAEELEKKHAEK